MKQIVLRMEDDESDAPDAASALGSAADLLRVVLEQETRLARSGALNELEVLLQQKQQAATRFMQAVQAREHDDAPPYDADQDAIRRMMAAAEENALILSAVLATATDLNDRLRTALTSGADPGTYGPKGRGPRHAMAARYDTRI